ncbi:MAG: hypothetical protein D6812_05235, partial [Deltaproteobacteria bacterium]
LCCTAFSSCPADRDNDSVPYGEDNCPTVPNPDQEDGDGDGVGDLCDLCPDVSDPEQQDEDGDGHGDACDPCPEDPDHPNHDGDGDEEIPLWYPDADGDGFGVGEGVESCSFPGWEFAVEGGDCNDANEMVGPFAEEVCDGIDNDCDGVVDEGFTSECSRICDIEVPADFATIQEAIDAAPGGETICVRAGTYTETIDFGGKAIALIGIDGPEETTIDAEESGPVVRFVHGEGRETILSGFTITGGKADSGAGIRIEEASPRLYHLHVSGNYTWHFNIDEESSNGAGIFVSQGAPVLMDLLVSDNEVLTDGCVANNGEGGGLYARMGSHLFLYSVTFQRNHAGDAFYKCTTGGSGGGIFLHDSSLFLREGTFEENRGGYGYSEFSDYWAGAGGDGGAIGGKDAWLKIVGATFRNNHAGWGGSGITEFGSPYPGESGGKGGAIALYNSLASIEQAFFYGNGAGDGGSGGSTSRGNSEDAGDGGSGGAIFVFGGRLEIVEAIVIGNEAGSGGSSSLKWVYGNDFPYLTIAHIGKGGHGGGIYVRSAEVLLRNLIIAGNRSGDGGNAYGFNDAFCDTQRAASGVSGGHGGGIALFGTIATIENLTLFRNETGEGGDGGDLYSDCLEDPD